MRLSLRYRLLLPLALLLFGDAAATAWAATTAARVTERRLAGQLWAVARTLTESRPDGRNSFPFTNFVLVKMKGLSGAEFLFVHPDRPPVTTLPGPAPAPPADVAVANPTTADDDHQLGPPVTIDGNEYRCLRLRLHEPHQSAGGDLYIFYPEFLRRTAVWDAARPPLVIGVGGGLLAVGLAFATGTGLVRRIRVLEHRTRLIAGGDFQPMPLPRVDDELTDLCRSVNDMARRLTDYQEAMQRSERLRVLGQFSGGLAHQLRNAASGAKLAVEVFLTENPSADPEPLRVALRQLARIEGNVRQFLDLGKPPATDRTICDLNKLIGQAVSLLKPQCQHAGVVLNRESAPGNHILAGDVVQLSHLFGNVIGNAVEAAGPGGTVEVHTSVSQADETQGWFVAEISDSGSGPPPEVAGKLFEPFVTGKAGGIGLGLAVAKQTAEMHGGQLSWSRQASKTVFRIELPLPASGK